MPPKNSKALIARMARRRGLDPRAVLSVAAQEGLGGGIGDNGTSFGPFQLHVGGAFPSSIGGNRQAWAWSPQGIAYALNQMARVAGGLRGRAAISNIVKRFERPADPAGEISRALASYGGAGREFVDSETPLYQSTYLNRPAPLSSPTGANNISILLHGLLADEDLSTLIPKLQTPAQEPSLPPYKPLPLPSRPKVGAGYPGQAELFYDPLGAYKYGRPIAPVGNHSDHVHFAATNPQTVLAAIALARRLGLNVTENPYVGPVHRVHVSDSYHYRNFPGRYGGRQLGEGFDASGGANQMAQLFKLLAPKRRTL